MSRAQWLAFGSLAVVGCAEHFPALPASQHVADATTPEASASDDPSARETAAWDDGAAPDADSAEDATVLEANTPADTGASHADSRQDAGADTAFADVADTALADAADADGCAVPTGTFLCPTYTSSSSAPLPYCPACDRATQYCSEGLYQRGCFDFADDAGPFSFPPQCGAQPTCACLRDAGVFWQGPGNCTCDDLDDAGAFGLYCAQCYGSPPARLLPQTRQIVNFGDAVAASRGIDRTSRSV